MYIVEVHEKYKHYEYCVVVTHSGHRCGHVKTEDYDLAYGKKYDELHSFISCHGGLTYSDFTSFTISHGYWIGFDCSHLGDSPDPKFKTEENKVYYRMFKDGTVRTKDFCIEECKSMIDDIIEMNRNESNGGLRIGNKSMF